ncbi:hypothetical protein A2316_01855 [Candidatus Falkowbacteria bacterium RIFOXYB2_FULL_38_15]|uniref:Tim44-like domain-containing protein n=1 Tax=Candidatus Falkowbacteria bacterium RIFOXYA2_FULL_38_12 TaxID=1797993 RepID=A0A1F5S3H4_9BACT|nr:MAG: hypothetical protein A2257_03635 [Candidatus Falkowbacteria bacterium RIFOXYA2_FULL_38_12]OGF32696.1 MAG: hypothetical protein A2316_01855 [Candidatus Falkowbacteria bacterium RIFOXYB2_FULL_38_15]OGF42100.1 MAG: hypothetical protein A2555_01750 [Candidatus Falkowbacteria bacterium RIFOXYD2_FULL_39_16]
MYFSRRTKIVIAIVIILLLAFLLYWFLWRGKSVNDEEVQSPPPPIAIVPQNKPAGSVPPEPVKGEEKTKADLGRLAAAFAERFGSYSNQGEYANVLDLKPIMTGTMQKWVDDYVAESKAAITDVSVYSGITTKAVSSKITAINEKGGTATVVVNTQREGAGEKTAENKEIYYQNLELEFQKISDEWKVNKANWLE